MKHTKNFVSFLNNIVTCQPIQRFVARQHLRKHATIMQKLLGSRPRLTMEPQLEGVFYVIRPEDISRQ
jgi:hypothetical protein